jgi:HD-GYP domain-containing protein (c-di-GMP phosphodiesterase class II)
LIEARILRVADVFAALVEPRYKSQLAASEAIAQMRLLDGKLDPACLTVLERLVIDDAAAVAGGDDSGS